MKIQSISIIFQTSKIGKLEMLGNTGVNESPTQLSKSNVILKRKAFQ